MIQQTIAPTRKLLSIERFLEWAFSVELVQLEPPQDRGSLPSRSGYASLWNSIIQMHVLGVRVDTSIAGATFLAGEASAHWDAEAAAAVIVNSLQPRVAQMLAAHAKAGTRPTWMPGAAPRCVPAGFDGTGAPKVVDAKATNFSFGVWRPWLEAARRSKRAALRADFTKHEASDEVRGFAGKCTPVVMQPSRQQIETARETYVAWWTALHTVREHLIESGVLRSHELSREMPPATPWQDDGTNPLVETGTKPDWRK